MFETGTRVVINTHDEDRELDGRTGTVVPVDLASMAFEDEHWVRLDGPGTKFWGEGEEVPFAIFELTALEG